MSASSILLTGGPYILEEIGDNPGYEPCKIYVYKDPKNIPPEVLSRLGLKDFVKQDWAYIEFLTKKSSFSEWKIVLYCGNLPSLSH